MLAGTSDGSETGGPAGAWSTGWSPLYTCCDLGGSAPTSMSDRQPHQLTALSVGCDDGQISRPGLQHMAGSPQPWALLPSMFALFHSPSYSKDSLKWVTRTQKKQQQNRRWEQMGQKDRARREGRTAL